MPHNSDFSKLKDIKTIEVNPPGWVSPLYIEYGIYDGAKVSGVLSYYWRVKGTLHTFVIPISRMDFLSSGDYKKHFETVLIEFREEYIQWKNEYINIDWVKEYENQYSKFIII